MSKVSIDLTGSWEPLLRPKKFARYINDHTIFKDKNGKWRLLGTCAKSDYAPYKENFFIEGVTDDLAREMVEIGPRFEGGPNFGIKIAPTVFYNKKDGLYHLFYASINIYHCVSSDGINWEKEGMAVRSFWPALRDPHVVSAGNKYLMYLTDFGNVISVFKSDDLYSWKKIKRPALILGNGVPKTFNSSCESPIIFSWNNKFILTTTITPADGGRRYNYTRTIVFISDDPENFGRYAVDASNSSIVVTTLETHAPEIVEDRGRFFITTCGWKGYPKPVGVSGEGVYLRELNIY